MDQRLSLTELQLIIRDSLYMAFPEMYWVTAEISEIKENYNGHCYLELIEKQPDEKNVRSRVKAIIWSKKYGFLKSLFENVTGERFREGLKILVKVKVEYHELYGLSLIICDIDPAFTIGDMARKRQIIIKKLEEDGVFNMNKELQLPIFPQRIGIISSKKAAGYSDFMNHLHNNSYGYVYYTFLFESAMQGVDTERGIIAALDKIAEHSDIFDIVVILRGGGSLNDLSWFDNYNIAYHITQFPLPVITGIGHDKDMSVTDMVANHALKTPTAVADFIIDLTNGIENHLFSIWSEIRDLSRLILERNRGRIESSKIRLLPLSRLLISGIRDRLAEIILEVTNNGKENLFRAGHLTRNQLSRLESGFRSLMANHKVFISKIIQDIKNKTTNSIEISNLRIETMEKSLYLMKPENVLKRGYTITSLNGRILKTGEELTSNDIIGTQFIDGEVKSKVIENKTFIKNLTQ